MARLFFTSDLHAFHANCIKLSDRPFKNLNHMHYTFIRNINERVNSSDILISLGDWSFGGSTKAQSFEDKLNCRVWHIQGNHCKQNKIKGFKSAIMELGGKKALLQHVPPRDILDIPYEVSFVLVGHVHNRFKHTFVENIPIINVGIDVWNYYPVSLPDILKYYDKIMKGMK